MVGVDRSLLVEKREMGIPRKLTRWSIGCVFWGPPPKLWSFHNHTGQSFVHCELFPCIQFKYGIGQR